MGENVAGLYPTFGKLKIICLAIDKHLQKLHWAEVMQ
jgi:hypothetical protein